jgi:aspartokinase
MVSIAQLVEERVLEQPFLADALQRGILNYGAVADELLPSIQQVTKRNVRHAAVMMALRRFAERLEKQELTFPTFSTSSNVILQSDMFELTTTKSKEAIAAIRTLRDSIDQEGGDLLTVTQGLHEYTIISNKQHLRRLKALLKKAEIKSVIEELSLLTIKIPDEAIDSPGYFYSLIKALTWENINIVEIVSTLTELTFAIKDEQVPHAYRVVKRVLSSKASQESL